MANFPNNVAQTILVSSGGFNLDYNRYFGSNILSNLSEEDQKPLIAYWAFLDQHGENPQSDSIKNTLNKLSNEAAKVNILKGYLFDKSKVELVSEVMEINMNIWPIMKANLARDNWNLEDRLNQLDSTNTIIIQGRQDPIDLETARQINNAIKGSQLTIIEESGHFPWIERPDEFYSVLNDFLIKN